jgi:hypothetical protein
MYVFNNTEDNRERHINDYHIKNEEKHVLL